MSLLYLLPGAALAQSSHPGCYNGYCPTPPKPDRPVISPSPSLTGSYEVKAYNNDPYSSFIWNTGETTRGNWSDYWARLNISGKPTGQYSYKVKRCIYGSGTSSCSGWSPSASVTVLRTAGAPSISSITSNACAGYLTMSWAEGSGNPSGSTVYYSLEQSLDGGVTWSGVSSRTNTTITGWTRSGTERAKYHYRIKSRYALYGQYSSYTGRTYASAFTMPECVPNTPAKPSLSQPNVNTSTNVQVSWVEPVVPIGDILGYRVQRRDVTANSSWTTLTGACATSSTSCTDSEPHTRDHTYQYRVQAYKSTVSSPWSATSSITVAYAQPSTPTSPSFTGVGIEPYRYTVNWSGGGNGNSGSITYKLWEKIGSQETWTSVGTATSKSYTNRAAATVYQYKVQVCNSNASQLCATSSVKSISFPGTPGAIGVSGITDAGRDYTLSWSAASGSVSNYELMQSTNNGASWTAVPNLDGASLSEKINNSTAGVSYRYKVRACNSQACGPYSAVRAYWAPKTPVLSSSLNALSLSLSWQNAGAHHYQLERSVNGGGWQSVNSSYTSTAYTASVGHGSTYVYRVRACNDQNACSTPAESSKTVPPATPASIAAVQPAPAERTDVVVSWPAVSGIADGYYLERRDVTAGGSFSRIATVAGANTVVFTDAGVQANHEYQYHVQAYKSSLTGPFSPASTALRVRYPRPTVNLGVSGADQQTDGVYGAGYNGIYSVTWSLGETVTSFILSELEPGGAWQASYLTALNCAILQCDYDKPFNNSGADHVYRYRGQACNVDYCVEQELTVNVKTYPTPGQPTAFNYQFDGTASNGAYTLRWSAPSSSPPNMTGPNAEAVSYYQLVRVSPTGAGPWQITHSDTQTVPYTQAFTGVSGQTYTYAVAACFRPNEPNAETVCSGNAGNLAVRIPYAPPNQPGSLNHTNLNANTGSYTLTWTAAAGEVSRYELQYLNGDGQWANLGNAQQTNPSYPASHDNGETRSYRVRACNVDECGAYTDAHAVYVPHLQPGLPTGLAVQSQDAPGKRLTLRWSAPTGGGEVQTYEVEKSGDGGASWQAEGGDSSTMLPVNDLSNGTAYLFHVRACNVDACSGYTAPLAEYLPFIAPGIPGAVSHASGEVDPAAGGFTVHWSAPASINASAAPVSYYQVEYSSGANWQPAPTGGATPGRIDAPAAAPGAPAGATLNSLGGGVAYSVRVRACNADACGGATDPHQVYLPRPAPAVPAWLPTSPSSEDYAARRFTVQWSAPASGTVDHYRLESYGGMVNGYETWLNVAETPATAYTFADRAYGEVYRYRVRACSEPQSTATSCSTWAVSGEIRLKFPTPNVPGGVAVSELDQVNGRYTLSWNGVLGWAPEYRYELEENMNNAGWQPLGSVTDPVHTLAVSGQDPGTYRHRVRACNPAPDSDCGAWSPEASVTVLPTPTAPATFNVASLGGQTCDFNLEWTPPTGGQGIYHYEVAAGVNGAAPASLAWTTGTSHSLMVNQEDSGDTYTFRVRARTLSNGQYSPWGPWRNASGVTSCDYSLASSTDQLYIAAPRYSESGQYTVEMQYSGSNVPGLRYLYEVWAYGVGWSSLSLQATPPAMATVTYGPSNPRPTNRYRYRVRVCDYDVYPNDNPIACSSTADSTWDMLTIDTTVLRDPGDIGPLQVVGLPNAIDGAYLVPNGQFTLDWRPAPNDPGPSTYVYEIQYKPANLTDAGNWMVWADHTEEDLQVTLPEFGMPFDFRVRGCAHLDSYVNCGDWAQLNHPVKQSIGPPRFAANTYPADGELVIYDRRVPLQWLPPWEMADAGIDHYEISLRSRQTDADGDEFWVGPDVLATPAPNTGSNSNPPVQQAMVEIEQGGQKEFLIRACGSDSPDSCGEALSFQITVVIPPEPPEAPTGMTGQADPDSYAAGEFNGALSGEFSVQASGAASYTLPIVVPPGTAGVQPEISLNYSSQAGNGIAGWGWSIGGLSAITRCNKTLTRDGEIRGIDYSDNDAWCLDGQRLIDIGNNQYRTELNNFSRITKMSGGVCGTWFEVKTQAGQTLEYGNSDDACIDARRHRSTYETENVVQGWALNKVTDVSGNYMTYHYQEDVAQGANNFAIDHIEYTGHTSGVDPDMTVDFQYDDDRADPIGGFQGGVGVLQARRLFRIVTGISAEKPAGYGVYTLNYEEDGDLISRLTSVNYCATDDANGSAVTQCVEPLAFEWSPSQPGWEQLAGYAPPRPFTEGYPGTDLGARLVDLNNDGLPDLLYANSDYRGTYRNTGGGWQIWPAFQPPVAFIDSEGKNLGVQLADINGDSLPELLTSRINANGGYDVYENTGSGWSLNASMALPESLLVEQTIYIPDQPVPNTSVTTPLPDTDNGLRLADLDADGLPDLIHGGPDGTRQAWRNTGNGTGRWEPWSQYTPPVGMSAMRSSVTDWPLDPPAGFEDKAYDPTGWLADFNGDGLPDLMYKTTPHTKFFSNKEQIEYRVRLNTGAGWGASSHAINAMLDIEAHGPDAGIRLADLNADGLPDLVRGNHAGDLIRYNTGTGWYDTPFLETPTFQSGGVISVTPKNRQFLDLNHDGRTDILLGSAEAWLSSEAGWVEKPLYGAPFNISIYPVSVRVADVNGDGRLDLLGATESSNFNSWTQRSGRRHITAVSDGLGNTTTVKYQALTDKNLDGRSRPLYSRTEQSMSLYEREANAPMQVVSRVNINDGIGGELSTEYAYKGLTASIGRGLQGFEEMTAYKPDGKVATTRYASRFPYTGLPLELSVTYGEGASARLLERTAYEYCHAVTSESTAGYAANPETPGFTSASGTCGAYTDQARDNESVFVFTNRTTVVNNRLSDDLQSVAASVTTVTDHTYGPYGYSTRTLSTTTGDGNIYTTEVVNTYNDSQPDWPWLGRLHETVSTRRVNGQDDGNNTRKTRYEYYTDTGLLKKEIVEPDAQAPLKLVTAHAYDTFGNATQTTVCASDFVYCEAGADNPNAGSAGSESFRTTTVAYDGRGRYQVSAANALNHTETYAHEHPLGLKTYHRGPNGLETTWKYDSLGRKVSEITPFGTTYVVYRKADGGFVPGAKYSVQETPPAAAPHRVYYDGKGRERRTLTQSLHGEWVAADIEYDHFGRVKRESAPYFVYGGTAGDVYWTETDYDTLGRVSEARVPLGDIDSDGVNDGIAVTRSDYRGFETVTTDAKSRRKLEEQNALGQTVRVVDDLDGLNIPIDYTYDSQDNLETTTVDNNPATTVTIQYDRRGRKLNMTDPDMGYWEYQYNGYGELVWQRDAKQQVTEIDYDKLGRMIERREQPAGETLQTSYWVYDTAPGASIGKLHSETGPQSSKVHSYTGRGQLAETEHRINVNGWSQTFITSQTYDAFGRVQLIYYPEVGGQRQVVENRYSPFGGLWYVLDTGEPLESGDESVYWIAELVDERGQVMQELLRNRNSINNMTNRATGWLQKVESWDKNDAVIQQTRYVFDQVGNVESRERFRPWIVYPDGSFHAGDNEQVVENFGYDSLDRLTSSSITRDGVLENDKSHGYDRLGNFEYKDANDNLYGYNTCNAGPHAVCTANGASFTYDANGNMTASSGAKARTIAYTAFNKPAQITENGATVNFVYGADHSRVFKQATTSGGQTEITWYVGLGAEGRPLYEQTAVIGATGLIENREHQNFIYAGGYHGGQAFAVNVQEEDEDNNPAQPNTVRYSGTEYYHRDHLGSVIAITGDTGEVEETRLLSFDAWGKRRNADWSESPDGDGPYTGEGMRGNLGYTGHEAIPEVGLIHMNGRVYDPELGRFLSADPHVQFGDAGQSYNRYSYVQNNPLRYSDPSGYFINNLLENMPSKMATFISVVLNFIPGCQVWCSMVFNAAYADANGATFGDVLLSGAVGFFASGFGGIAGNAFGSVIIGGAVSGAISGGINSALNGGNFFRGALRGALRGAASTVVMLGVRKAIGAMQPQGVNQELPASDDNPAQCFLTGCSSKSGAGPGVSRFTIGKKDFKVIGGSSTDRANIETDLTGIFSTPDGAKMLSTLEDRKFLWIFDKTFTIDLRVTNNAYTFLFADTVYVDPGFHPTIQSTAGPIPATTQRILAHELGHAVNGVSDSGPARMDNIRLNENPIMNSLGQPSRTAY